MKTSKIIAFLLFISILIYSCQKNESDLFSVKILEKEGLPHITYLPNIDFKEVPEDSVHMLYNEKDHFRVLSSEIKIAQPIFKNELFSVRIYTRSSFQSGYFQHGFLVRTFSKDGRIKDERVLASTIDGLSCEGRVTSDLKIITSCPDGIQTIAQIEKDGSIKITENE